MDTLEAIKVVLSRMQKFEPENGSKIVKHLLLQDHGDREMIRLAFSPDSTFQSVINKAKSEISVSSAVTTAITTPPANSYHPFSVSTELPLQFTPFSPASSRPFSSPANLPAVNPYWDTQALLEQHHHPPPMLNLDFGPLASPKSLGDEFGIHSHTQFLGLDDQISHDFVNDHFYSDPTLGGLTPRGAARSPTSIPPDMSSIKPCLYYARGYCKNGSNCRFFHSHSVPDNFSPMLNGRVGGEFGGEDALERLELELSQLLRAKRQPVSIASLPQTYNDRYQAQAQAADGYLTAADAKTGFGLTKLLTRLKGIRVIDRPHGQHSVVLAEDAHKFPDYRNERTEPGGIAAASRQIYLTFPAESTFTEEDVSNYFRNYGPVQDVRIPSQQKRMFGFVTFLYPETVRVILSRGNPHFVCGARVLVKPYKEKTRVGERKYQEKFESQMYYPSHCFGMEPDFHSGIYDGSARFIRKHVIEEQEQMLELERRRLVEFQLSPKPLTEQYLNHHASDELKLPEDRFVFLLDAANTSSSTSDDENKHSGSNYSEQESNQVLNLPESPFASPVNRGIATVI